MFLQDRETGFDNDFGVRSKLPEYNALQDENMKRFFENSHLQQHLWQTGQVSQLIMKERWKKELIYIIL